MLNVSRILSNQKFNQSFTVHRKSGSWVAGRFAGTEQAVTLDGVIIPASAKEIEQLPEGDRVTGIMIFYATQEIFTTHKSDTPGTSDEIEWRGARYRIFNVNQYSDYGYYKAYGVYMEGD